MPGVSGVTVVTTRVFTTHHARLRAHQAPGIPCALCLLGRSCTQTSGALRRGNSLVMPGLDPGIHQTSGRIFRRGWITGSSPVMTVSITVHRSCLKDESESALATPTFSSAKAGYDDRGCSTSTRFYTGQNRRSIGRKNIAILIAKPMFQRIDRSRGRSPR